MRKPMKPKKKTTQNIPSAVQTPEEKCRSRYLFGALGQILYAMPSLALVGMIYVMGAALPGLIAAVVTVLMGIAVGFAALACMKKNRGRMLLSALCFAAVVPHVISLLLLGGWYAILLPAFLLDMLLLSGMKAIGK